MTNKIYSLPASQNITREILDNGIIILVYENHSVESVVMVGSLAVGGVYEGFSRNGLASMTISSLMRGTTHRDFDTLYAELEDIGANLNIGSGNHRSTFSGRALAEDLPIVIEMLSDVLRHPAFPEDQVERLRGERLTALRYNEQDTRWVAAQKFRELLYPENHPYHYGVQGTAHTIPTIQISEMRDFHQKNFGPQGMTIVIVGAIHAQAAIDIVRQHFSDWQNVEQPVAPVLSYVQQPMETRRIDAYVPGKTQSDIILGRLGPSRFASDFHAVNLVNSILGQFGMMGRIGEIVREQEGMAYYAYSRLNGGFGPGPWSVAAGVNPSNVERAIALCVGEIERLVTELVSEDDLLDNQSYFTGNLPLQLENNHGIALTLHFMEIFDLGMDYLLGYADLINNLTRESLYEAARNYLNPEALVIAVAGPNKG